MKFDWNPDKNEENKRKHEDVSFEEAVEVFFDAMAYEEFDKSHSDLEEIRFTRIGNSAKRLLRVSYTIREDETDDEIIRIISARKGKAKDERKYYEQNI